MEPVVVDQQGRSFYLEINSDLDIGELPSIFYTRYKDYLPHKLGLYDMAGNVIWLEIEKGYRTAIIVSGYRDISKLYSLLHGGWLSLCFLGGDQFLITDVKDHNMMVKGPCFPATRAGHHINLTGVAAPLLNLCDHDDDGDFVMADDPLIDSEKSWVDVSADWIQSLSLPNGDDKFHGTKGGATNVCRECGSILNTDVIGSKSDCDSIKEVLALGECKFAFDHDKLIVDFLGKTVCADKKGLHEMYYEVLNTLGSHNNDASGKGNPGLDDFNAECPPKCIRFFHYIQRVVTYYQVSAYSLIIPSKFASRAFPSKFDCVNVISANAPNMVMKIRWRARRSYEAFLTRGWKEFVGHHGLRHGSVIRMFVPEDDETVMYIAVVLV
ncbi:hypothetical protein PIB30_037382 [Stylosanthes scabra]|uniref:TF-B3 domain-containing protein n=1 Tax=Stylosanthes scabra TaxID=79078 RepID=A0ABU6WC63_9FABA|nr:hypothetical protein [Stylosanthes scabra]